MATRLQDLPLDRAALHALHLGSLGGGGQAMDAAMQLALEANFGSIERWHEAFVAMGKAPGEGSGWVLLVFQPGKGRLVNHRAADSADAGAARVSNAQAVGLADALAGGVPILALELDEHAQRIDAGAAVPAGVEAFMGHIDWAAVHARFQHAVHAASESLGASLDDIGDALVLDVRRAGVYASALTLIPGARWCDPATVGHWCAELPAGRAVIVYCVRGHEVSRAVALRLRAAGLDARFLRGGIDGWQAAGRPLIDKPATPAKSANPATPATPATPAMPAMPAMPAKSAKSANPATPATPAKSANPATQATPAKSATSANPKEAGAMTVAPLPRVALLYPGDRAARDLADPAASRFAALFEAFADAGVHAEPAVYQDDFADEVAAQLRDVQAVLVWCNPIHDGRRRDRLDALLREVARGGVFVSAHPDVILRLGTKDVLFDTRDLPFGSDVHRIDSLAQLASELPQRLRHGARVLKQHRGHSGIGVWRVEQSADGALTVQHAQRGSTPQRMDLATLQATLAPCFEPANGARMIDQAWQPRLAEGMVRAYLVEDHVAGFGVQAVNALHPDAPLPGPRLYHGPELPEFQALRQQLESSWVTLLRERVGLARDELPLLWDCDFMLGEAAADGAPRFVLCEVNVSSVSPFPPSATTPLVEAVCRRIDGL
jgi:superoxide dismutase/rhodanese-related sulfurtransferase